jgi:hypothetical protein
VHIPLTYDDYPARLSPEQIAALARQMREEQDFREGGWHDFWEDW